MQNFNGLNKNIVILGAMGLVVVVAALYLLFQNTATPIPAPSAAINGDTAAEIDKNIAELNNLDTDVASFAQDDIVSAELGETINEVGEIDETTENLIEEEENLSNLDSDLEALSGDEAIDQEIDQALQEVSL